MDFSAFDRRPIIVAIAGPNGAGKSTFYNAHLASTGLRFVNADILSHDLNLDPYSSADVADKIRRELLRLGESFIFETVFSDPLGDKIDFLEQAVNADYEVVLCFVGIENPDMSVERVAMRVSQGGHDVPDEKLSERFPRTLANLARAIERLPHVLIFDNSNLSVPFRRVAIFERAKCVFIGDPVPSWLRQLIPDRSNGDIPRRPA